jgi:hypothetical protein
MNTCDKCHQDLPEVLTYRTAPNLTAPVQISEDSKPKFHLPLLIFVGKISAKILGPVLGLALFLLFGHLFGNYLEKIAPADHPISQFTITTVGCTVVLFAVFIIGLLFWGLVSLVKYYIKLIKNEYQQYKLELEE